MDYQIGAKRKREPREEPYQRQQSRTAGDRKQIHGDGRKGWSATDQARLNKIQEEDRHREFLAKEGQFVLQQKRKAAEIRVKEGRAQPIDWLAVNLRIIDPVEDLINGDPSTEAMDYFHPEAVIDGLSMEQLARMDRELSDFLDLEHKSSNREYWRTMRVLVKERQHGVQGKATRSVSSDINNLLEPKTYEELQKLERQIHAKLDSDEPIDTDYWQQLLDSLLIFKAKAKLKKLYRDVIDKKSMALRQSNQILAEQTIAQLRETAFEYLSVPRTCNPQTLPNLNPDDKRLRVIDEQQFLDEIVADRRRVSKAGYVHAKRPSPPNPQNKELVLTIVNDAKQATSQYDREAAQGMEEDEELFAGEEQVETKGTHLWKAKYRPRKPRYFNRVQMGYEWNKYNQTHYDHDNPPPKVVQGYKFHIFYPDLIDATKAPTYKISREGGRKKGETLAPAGEEDTCIIRFMSGPPYEDIAFRVVDRDWDYSAKYDRGFKSTFEKGILTLHFSFKKVYYRK